jgi:hypothetical protein
MAAPPSAAPTALYRATGLGRAFTETLSEMFAEQELSNDQVIAALLAFDRSFNKQLETRTPANKIDIEAKLAHYRFCDGVWSLQLTNATFTGSDGVLHSPSIKVVAGEAKGKGRRTRK